MIERVISGGQTGVERTKEPEFPTRDDQVYRISGTAAGGAIFGGALATVAGGSVTFGAVIGGLLGLGIATLAASKAQSRRA